MSPFFTRSGKEYTAQRHVVRKPSGTRPAHIPMVTMAMCSSPKREFQQTTWGYVCIVYSPLGCPSHWNGEKMADVTAMKTVMKIVPTAPMRDGVKSWHLADLHFSQ